MTFEEYGAIDAVNVSTLKWMAKSPRHFAHVRAEPKPDTATMMLGRGGHTAILEPDRFPLDYAVWDGDRRGKGYAAFCEANPDRTILKVAEYERCLAMRDAVRSHPVAGPLLSRGTPEVVLLWTDEETGLACKGRLDWLGETALVDLKTTVDVEPLAFGRTAARMRYPLQLAFYAMGLRTKGIELSAAFTAKIIAVESSAPHDVAVYTLSDDDLWLGECEARRLLARVKACQEMGEWPGQCPGEMPLALPTWAFQEAADDDSFGLVISDTEAA